MPWTPHIHSDLSRGSGGVQGSIAGQREATRVSGCVSEGKSHTGRYPMRGLSAEEGLPTHLYLTMGGSNAKVRGTWRQLGQLPWEGPQSTKQAGLQILKGWSLQRWGEHLRREGSQATLDPDRERKQTKFPWPTDCPGPWLAFLSDSFPHWQIDHSTDLSTDDWAQPKTPERQA